MKLIYRISNNFLFIQLKYILCAIDDSGIFETSLTQEFLHIKDALSLSVINIIEITGIINYFTFI